MNTRLQRNRGAGNKRHRRRRVIGGSTITGPSALLRWHTKRVPLSTLHQEALDDAKVEVEDATEIAQTS